VDKVEIETPWGDAAFAADRSPGDDDRFDLGPVAVATRVGLALVTFRVDPDEAGGRPLVRVDALAGCNQTSIRSARPGGPPCMSSLSVDGEILGWRAKGAVDPLSGEFADDEPIHVGLFDKTGRSRHGLGHDERSVSNAFYAAVNAATSDDPALFAKLYVALMERHVAELNEGVKAASKAMKDAATLHGRASDNLADAVEVIERHRGPAARR